MVTTSARVLTIVVETSETSWVLLLLSRLGSKVLELLNAVLVRMCLLRVFRNFGGDGAVDALTVSQS